MSDGEGNFKRDALLRAHFLEDLKILIDWAWSDHNPGQYQNLASDVFADWDSRRSLQTDEFQEIFEKKPTFE